MPNTPSRQNVDVALRWRIFAALACTIMPPGANAIAQHAWRQPPPVETERRWDGGFSFRVTFGEGQVEFGRTNNELPDLQRVAPAYLGEVQKLFTVGFGPHAAHQGDVRGDWVHRTVGYELEEGTAEVVLSRLSPAVLIDSPGGELTLGTNGTVGGSPSAVAFVSNGKVAVHRVAGGERKLDISLDEPWLVAWFGNNTPCHGYTVPVDVDDPIRGADKASLQQRRRTRPLDLPLLIRLEHPPTRLGAAGGRIDLEFKRSAGKVAIMPLFGGRLFLSATTEKWLDDGLPQEIVAQARRWSRALRDFPLSVAESYSVDSEGGELTVSQRFRWSSFDDDWKTPVVKAAPLPPMLAVALGGDVPVTFFRDGWPVQPVDYNLMDTPGKAMAIESADRYEYRFGSLRPLVVKQPQPARTDLPDKAASMQQKLERHVAEMIDAGPLAPLFFVYGGIGGSAPSYFYWADSAELAQALHAAFPFLSTALREKAKDYLRAELRRNPPLKINRALYRTGSNRAPYEVPWDDVERALPAAELRETQRRTARMFGDLYGVHAGYALTGEFADAEGLHDRAVQMIRQLLARQDWALAGPVWRTEGGGFFQNANYFNRNGQAKYNAWLAGALGFTRLALDLGWKDDEPLGWYCFGKLALARIGQARYTAEMHRMGLVDGRAEDDWRTLVHVDRNAAIVMRGAIAAIVREDQELPPFIDLVPEVGVLLGRHARQECRTYLDQLDRSMPLWYLQEAPKQSATEQRLCPLQHHQGNVLAQYWVLNKRGPEFRRYVDVTRFTGDLYYIQNVAALLHSYGDAPQSPSHRPSR